MRVRAHSALLVLVAALPSLAVAEEAPPRLVGTAPNGVAVTVPADGLASVRLGARRLDLAEGIERPLPWLFRHRMTPLVDDWLLRRGVEELRALAAEYLDGKGHWKR